MSFSNLEVPQVAEDVARFGDPTGTKPRAATINYDLPLPMANAWDRIVPLDIPKAWFTAAAGSAGMPLTASGTIKVGTGGRITAVDEEKLKEIYRAAVPPTSRPPLRAAATLSPPSGAGKPKLATTEAER